ncbi:MAG TPA: hypothetical protein PL155_02060 [Candidatus Omnitrophota bacterium]|nr:hypothetical protein [Candidatus Omnitrophota bacterium]HPD84727.1 hypothetical protein [Candidatus Omnitrophota bacterium]HRZ03585.1 hypothetical protein [Candidatus Omnitrophota bacterium]
MRLSFVMIILAGIICVAGCETVKKGTTAAGTVVGQGADTIGGVTEGAAEGYKGKDATADNPYGR